MWQWENKLQKLMNFSWGGLNLWSKSRFNKFMSRVILWMLPFPLPIFRCLWLANEQVDTIQFPPPWHPNSYILRLMCLIWCLILTIHLGLSWVVYGWVCIWEWTPKRCVLRKDWTMYYYLVNHSIRYWGTYNIIW